MFLNQAQVKRILSESLEVNYENIVKENSICEECLIWSD